MEPDKIDQLTIREKLRDCERLTRELGEHLQQNFLPKVVELQSLAVPNLQQEERVADVSIRNSARAVLESDQFTARLDEGLMAYAKSILRDAATIPATPK